jgi:uncharacterized RDD family membrane protein YckC
MTPITVLNQANAPTGPFTRAQVAEKLQSGEFSLTDLAFIEGLSQWTPLREVLAQVDGALPPLPPAAPVTPLVAASPAYSYAATMEPPSHLVYAGFWPRVAAHILDNLIVSIPFAFVWVGFVAAVVGLGVFTQLAHPQSPGPNAPTVAFVGTLVMLYFSLILGRFIAVWLYHAFLESGPHQSTWGKRVLGLKVTGVTGQRISFGHASGRYFSTLVTNMTMGIGYVMVAFTDRKQALHDMIAGTLVVKQ